MHVSLKASTFLFCLSSRSQTHITHFFLLSFTKCFYSSRREFINRCEWKFYPSVDCRPWQQVDFFFSLFIINSSWDFGKFCIEVVKTLLRLIFMQISVELFAFAQLLIIRNFFLHFHRDWVISSVFKRCCNLIQASCINICRVWKFPPPHPERTFCVDLLFEKMSDRDANSLCLYFSFV